MLTRNINFKNFRIKRSNKKIKQDIKLFFKEDSSILESLKPTYKNSFNKGFTKKFKKYSDIIIIGMGGSILGTESIYDFLKYKIKKNFSFINNLQSNKNFIKKKRHFKYNCF